MVLYVHETPTTAWVIAWDFKSLLHNDQQDWASACGRVEDAAIIYKKVLAFDCERLRRLHKRNSPPLDTGVG
jgi:hypothetical protein